MSWFRRRRLFLWLKGHADEASIAAFFVVAAVSVGIAATLYFGAPKAADVVTSGPPPVPQLDAEAGRGTNMPRGAEVGAEADKSIPRPASYLADHGIKYTWVGSPNWSARGIGDQLQAIVLHVAAGSCPGMDSWFKNASAQVSAHFAVCKDGAVHQYVELGDAAWHAGIVNRPDVSNSVIAAMTAAGINPNRLTVGIETELSPGEKISDYPVMQQSLDVLTSWLLETFNLPPDRTHIVGHFQFDSVNRSVDPICCINMADVVTEVAELVSPAPAIASPWGECDAEHGDCWLTVPAWVFDDGGVCVPSLDPPCSAQPDSKQE